MATSKRDYDGKIQIRQLKAEDADLSEIAEQVGSDNWDPALDENHPQELKRFLEQGGVYLLAYIGDQLAGRAYGYYHIHPNKLDELFIDEVDTKVEFRRQGVGTALVNAFREEGKKRGVDNVWLGTEHDNAAGNALYRSIPGNIEENVNMYTWE